MLVVRILPFLAVVLLVGCAPGSTRSGSSFFESKAEKALSTGVSLYDEGKYPEAISALQDALTAGLSADDQVKAHKHLAFTQCISGRDKLCREEFRKALDVNPAFELSPSEAGHPIWGPVYKSVKSKKTDGKK